MNMIILIYKIQLLPETFVELQKLFTYMCQCTMTFMCINIDYDRQILEKFLCLIIRTTLLFLTVNYKAI
jgi:hypothetical protein